MGNDWGLPMAVPSYRPKVQALMLAASTINSEHVEKYIDL